MPDESSADWSIWQSGDGVLEPMSFPGNVARYERRTLLGRGGMGEVFLAWDSRLRREVAIKRPRDDASASAATLLLEEARLVGHLQHPGIIAVHDLGTEPDGTPWVAMDVVRGRTLADALDSRDEGLIRAVLAVAEAVAYAHASGVVHRDLKPANVFVGAQREIRVGDWGLAATLPGFGWDGVLGERTAPSGAGTPGYLAPEQEAGADPDPRADVYSLGRLLAEVAIAGEALTPELSAIIDRATQPDPGQRYADARDFADDLARWLDGRRVRAYEYAPTELLRRVAWAWRAPLTVGLGASIALVVLGSWSWSQTLRERDRALVAERAAREALVQADASLSQALYGQARGAWERGSYAEAEVLASEAWRRRPSPELRGLLAGLAAQPRPTLVTERALPEDCRGIPLSEDIICVDRVGVSRWAPGADEPVWRRDFGVLDVSIGGASMLVIGREESGDLHGYELEVATGEEIARAPLNGASGVGTGGGAWLISQDQHVQVWGGPFVPLDCSTAVRTVGLSPDGQAAVAVCAEGRVFTGAPVSLDRPLPQETGPVSTVMLDAETAIFGTIGGELRAVDLADGEVLWTAAILTSPIHELCAAPDGRTVLAVGATGAPTAVDTRTGRVRARLPESHAGRCHFVDGDTVRLAGDRLRTWTLPPLRLAAVHAETGVSWAGRGPDGRLAATTGDGAVEIWTAEEHRAYRWQERVLKHGDWLSDGRLVVATLTDAGFVAVDGEGEREVWPIPQPALRRVGWLASGRLWGLGYGSRVQMRDVDGTLLFLGDETLRPVEGRGFPDRSGAVVLAEDGTVYVLLDEAEPSLNPVVSAPDAISVAGNETSLFTGSREALVAWSRQDGQQQWRVSLPTAAIDIAVSPSGARIAIGGLDGRAELRDARDGSLLATYLGHTDRVASVSFPSEGEVLTAGWDTLIRRWRTEEVHSLGLDGDGWGVVLDDVLR